MVIAKFRNYIIEFSTEYALVYCEGVLWAVNLITADWAILDSSNVALPDLFPSASATILTSFAIADERIVLLIKNNERLESWVLSYSIQDLRHLKSCSSKCPSNEHSSPNQTGKSPVTTNTAPFWNGEQFSWIGGILVAVSLLLVMALMSYCFIRRRQKGKEVVTQTKATPNKQVLAISTAAATPNSARLRSPQSPSKVV